MALTEADARAAVRGLLANITVPPGRHLHEYLQELAHKETLAIRLAEEAAKDHPVPQMLQAKWDALRTHLLDGGGSHHVDELLRIAEAALQAGTQAAFFDALIHLYKAERLNKTHITGAAPR